jgi:murein DD-endopeptidase MepM/ murein hydrolase activator NlpD
MDRSAISETTAMDKDGWESFERRVRDGRIGRSEGEAAVSAWAKRLRAQYPEDGFERRIFFPLRGYSLKDCGGRHGEGYQPKGYCFLDGNRHKGHPAQDIFIFDRNKDSLEDNTARPVDVLAMADGVVLSTYGSWTAKGAEGLRSGNYLWIYHPQFHAFSFCAHLRDIFVQTGQQVRGGEKIATLGRSGERASLLSSPTHLHFMLLRSEGMKPINPYPMLKTGFWAGDT